MPNSPLHVSKCNGESTVGEIESLIANETRLLDQALPLIVGVDEAGRGPWAGPVVAAAVIFPLGFGVHPIAHPVYQDLLSSLNDSKKLNETKRLALIEPIYQLALGVGIGVASPQLIDDVNIAQANYQAMRIAVQKALKSTKSSLSEEDTPSRLLLIDGLHSIPDLTLKQRAIVKGDQRSYHIAAASIIAKVFRDKVMIAADRQYPQYGFAKHKGYGTRVHQEALKKHGPCDIHRKTYKPIRQLLIHEDET